MKKSTLIFLILISVSSDVLKCQCAPVELQCEYLVNPIGIDAANPRLRWRMNDQRQGALQKAYRIVIGTDSVTVMHGIGAIWDTKKTKSGEMLATYQGKPLTPFTKYYWTVQIWDQNNKKSAFANAASFETGMMDIKNWKGAWITDTYDIHIKPAPYFRKVVRLSQKVKTARIYIAVAGLYELSINGKCVGDNRLDPAYTRFDRRTLYVTYDVTNRMNADSIAIGVLLGNGWYNHQSTAVWDFDKAAWRARPKFCLDCRIRYVDGSIETIASGSDWKTLYSPITLNSIYTGEHYDARLEQPGWDKPDLDDADWKRARLTSAPSQHIVAQIIHPIKYAEEITPKSVVRIDEKTYVFDLGRNIAGVSKFTVSGNAGTVFRLKHAEQIDNYGRADQSNIDVHYRPTDDLDPFQTDIFILKGEGEEIFIPRFNYKGFQYIEVECSLPIKLDKNDLQGIFMHSDVPIAGQIDSSNPIVDGIWKAANNSYLSNLFGYPTDCPQREKNGWTGDAHIAVETGLYNFDGITVYEKWMADHRDEQQPNGVLPSIIPTGGWGYLWGNGPDWTSTIAIIPWNLYLFYGDSKALEDCYDPIKKYVDHITDISPSGLTDWGLGDWVPVKSVTPKEFTSSIYYYVDALILANAAKVFHKENDHENYFSLSEKIKNAINTKYLNEETGIYGSGFQTEQSAALYWGIVPEPLKKKVAENLAKRVIADNKHIDVGLLGTKSILNALSENGYSDLAYEVASQQTYPSWGFWIKNGATTLLENWLIEAKQDISRNHIMFGEISAWFYKALGGIKPDPEKPGFKNVILEPHFVSQLDQFTARHQGLYGEIVSSWKRSENKVIYDVIIPANSTATLYLSAKKILRNGKIAVCTSSAHEHRLLCDQLNAGKYRFVIEDLFLKEKGIP